MNNVSFYGGGETTGSVAKRNLNSSSIKNSVSSGTQIPTLQEDTVSFKGHDGYEEKSSFLGTLTKLAIGAGIIVGGLGYAHKAGWVNKLGEGKFKDFANKVTEPCHNGCSKVKGWATEGWTKVKNMFSGNKKD